MSNLVSIETAAEILDTTPAALTTIASLRKKEKGVLPKWYISSGTRGKAIAYVDVDIILRNNAIRKKAWNYATEKLYFILHDLDGYSMQDYAKKLAEHTNDSVNSWAMFMSRDMWNMPNGNVYELKETKLFNFIRIMTMLIYGSSSDLKKSL